MATRKHPSDANEESGQLSYFEQTAPVQPVLKKSQTTEGSKISTGTGSSRSKGSPLARYSKGYEDVGDRLDKVADQIKSNTSGERKD